MRFDVTLANTIHLIKTSARHLTGVRRRRYQAQITLTHLEGHARRAESVFGWNRHNVTLGLHEHHTGIRCQENFHLRGRHRTEEDQPKLVEAIERLAGAQSQVDPSFKTPFRYTRLTASALHQALREEGWTEAAVPSPRLLNDILNRLNYRLRPVQKCRPAKKVKETDAIFHNVQARTQAADADPHTLRLSVDCKATVAVGDFSRDGAARAQKSPAALDHDMNVKEKVVPCGVLAPVSGQLSIALVPSAKTSDLVADVIEQVCRTHQAAQPDVQEVMLTLDNGPESSGRRSQFLQRMVNLADTLGLRVHLVYYPPYHSKYNPIERCWGVLERHWNGTLLSDLTTTLEWCRSMTWKGLRPLVWLNRKVYEKGVRLQREARAALEQRLQRSTTLPKWDILIEPASADLVL